MTGSVGCEDMERENGTSFRIRWQKREHRQTYKDSWPVSGARQIAHVCLPPSPYIFLPSFSLPPVCLFSCPHSLYSFFQPISLPSPLLPPFIYSEVKSMFLTCMALVIAALPNGTLVPYIASSFESDPE